MNHYPRHVGDYIRDTVGLTMLEDGAYTRLLDQYYAREAPLPTDKAMLYRMARATSPAERKAVDVVLAMFFTLDPDGYRQKRAELELAAQRERSAKAQESARLSWVKRNANADANADANASANAGANGMRTHSDGNASRKPVAIKTSLGDTPSREGPVDNSASPTSTAGEKSPLNGHTAAYPREWWKTEAGTIAYGAAKGIAARIGEGMTEYRQRLRGAA